MYKSELIGTAIGILVILIGIIVGKALDLLEVKTLIIGAIISFIIIWGIVLIIWMVGNTRHQSELNKIIENLRDIVPTAKYDWMYNEADIAELESKIKCKDIWIASPDLSHDTGMPKIDFIGVVKKNIRRKIKYTYVVPDTEIIQAVLPNLYHIFSSHNDQFRIIKLPLETFRMLMITHIIIMNPNMENNDIPQVYLELPIEKRISDRSYWIKVSDDAALGFVGRFRKLIEGEKETMRE